MNQHVHYDLAAYENRLRERFASQATSPVDDFHRLQLMGSEVVVQFGVFLARLDNEGVGEDDEANAACAVIASLIENLAAGFDGDRVEVTLEILKAVASYAVRGGQVMDTTIAPVVPGGRA